MVFLGKTPWCQSPTLGDLNRSSPWSHSPHGVYKVRSSSYVCWFISPFNLTIWLIPLMLRCEVVATYSNRWEIHHSQRILLDMIYIYIYIIYYIPDCWFQPLWKNICQLGLLFPIYGTIKNVPNHQPVCYIQYISDISSIGGPHLLVLVLNRHEGWVGLKSSSCFRFHD